MNLPEKDVGIFYNLIFSYHIYLNSILNLVDDIDTIEKLMRLDIKKRIKIRNAMYDNIDILDQFVEKNPYKLNKQQLECVLSWKNFIRGEFIIVKYLKKYTVFMSAEKESTKLYGVLGLTESLQDKYHVSPLMIKTVLLPYNDVIIYDGIINPYNISFGGGMKSGFNDEYNEIKAKYGIITSLPEEKTKEEVDKKELLKYYLKNEKNRDYYWDEIWATIGNDKDLEILYHQEIGKSNARRYGRRLKDIGINDAWFGILEGIIVASGKSKEDLINNMSVIVPKDKLDFVYQYKYKCR